uniref:Uncharacterized protein n=1 Tax=Arundo donax TaxID=35708 RepID=A0A0A8YBT9_ARUDO
MPPSPPSAPLALPPLSEPRPRPTAHDHPVHCHSHATTSHLCAGLAWAA